MKKAHPPEPHSTTEMLLYLQARQTTCRKEQIPVLRSIHQTVGMAAELANFLAEIMPDATPDQFIQGEALLAVYRKIVGRT